MKYYNEVHPLIDASLIQDLDFEQLTDLDLMEIERDFLSIYVDTQDYNEFYACMYCYFQSKEPYNDTVIVLSIQCSEYGLVVYKAEIPDYMINKDALIDD